MAELKWERSRDGGYLAVGPGGGRYEAERDTNGRFRLKADDRAVGKWTTLAKVKAQAAAAADSPPSEVSGSSRNPPSGAGPVLPAAGTAAGGTGDAPPPDTAPVLAAGLPDNRPAGPAFDGRDAAGVGETTAETYRAWAAGVAGPKHPVPPGRPDADPYGDAGDDGDPTPPVEPGFDAGDDGSAGDDADPALTDADPDAAVVSDAGLAEMYGPTPRTYRGGYEPGAGDARTVYGSYRPATPARTRTLVALCRSILTAPVRSPCRHAAAAW